MNRSLLDDLNPQQRAAVEALDGPVLILAGAGSGKTRVLTYRAAHLILNRKVHPSNILAVTFTNKAAGEMRQRVEQLIGGVPYSMSMGTFHSVCARLLRREIETIGWDRNFSIADESQQQTLVKSIFRDQNIDEKRLSPQTVLGRISAAKNELRGPQAVAERAETWIDRIVGQVYHTYQERLRLNNALDFDDLLTFPVHLFTESPETLERYRERWRYVMVDEFQDTNRVQYVLTRMLAQGHRNVCVVGDDDQSIYSWRGANIANMLDFEKDFPGARLIKLEQNYRSTQIILDVAHAVVVVNQGRKDKKLWTENGTGLPVSVQFMPSDVEEARFVVREIRRLEARGEARPQDCAVLYRTNAQSRLLERACVEDQLPYQVIGGPKFYERREIRDLLAYLRLIANPSDEASLKRIINTPPRGLGEKSLEELERFARAGGISLWQAIERVDDVPGLTARATTSIKAFHRLIAELAEAAGSVPLADLLGRIIEGSSYQQYINPDDSLEGQDRWENVGSLLTQAATFTPAEDQQALIQFLDEVALVSDQDALEDETPGATLITLHAAKGLEFPVVFIIGMSENIFPHRRVMEYPEQLEEERRLCYVGMTRAKRRLYLVHADRRAQWGAMYEDSTPSRFLLNIPQHMLTSPYGRNRRASLGSWGRGSFAQPDRYDWDSEWDGGGDSGWKQGELLRPGGHNRTGAHHRWEASETRPPQPAPAAAGPLYRAGLKVRHAKFGNGIVIRSDVVNGDENVTVAFEGHGVKKLSVAFAPLEPVG